MLIDQQSPVRPGKPNPYNTLQEKYMALSSRTHEDPMTVPSLGTLCKGKGEGVWVAALARSLDTGNVILTYASR